MRVLVTGNMGYVGPVVVAHLRRRFPSAELVGYDSALFGHCLSSRGSPLPEAKLNVQHFGDVRELPPDLLAGFDAVVHLAAVSNDPMGNRFERVTDEINRGASLRLASLARDAGVRAFVLASSCSIYGSADGGARREGDAVNPLTAYARSKVATEQGLRQADPGTMAVTCLRFATACGWSDRLRLDLVLNDFVACALSAGEVSILSDGTPWRPLLDVQDMARAIEWAILRPEERGGRFLAVNVGSDARNHQVRDLADAVAEAVPGTRVTVNADAAPDKRSYRVDFSLYRALAPEHQPCIDLAGSIRGLTDGLHAAGFADRAFRDSHAIRLRTLSDLIASGTLDDELFWAKVAVHRC